MKWRDLSVEEEFHPGNTGARIWAPLPLAPVSKQPVATVRKKSIYIKYSPLLMAFQHYCQCHLFLCTVGIPEGI